MAQPEKNKTAASIYFLKSGDVFSTKLLIFFLKMFKLILFISAVGKKNENNYICRS